MKEFTVTLSMFTLDDAVTPGQVGEALIEDLSNRGWMVNEIAAHSSAGEIGFNPRYASTEVDRRYASTEVGRVINVEDAADNLATPFPCGYNNYNKED